MIDGNEVLAFNKWWAEQDANLNVAHRMTAWNAWLARSKSVRPEAGFAHELRKLVEAVEKWDDAEEPDDLDMIEACVKARKFLDGEELPQQEGK